MFLVPYKQYLLDSDLRPDELRARVATLVEGSGEPFSVPNGSRYRGTVDERGFRIRKRIRHQNAYQPTIVGAFHPSSSGTVLQVAILVSEWRLLGLATVAAVLATLALVCEGWEMALGVLGAYLLIHTVFYLIGYLPARAQALNEVSRLCEARGQPRPN